MFEIILDYIHSKPDDVMAISSTVTAFFAFVMLFQLMQTSKWHRKNNFLTYYSFRIFSNCYEEYVDALKKSKLVLSSPVTKKEAKMLIHTKHDFVRRKLDILLIFFEDMFMSIDRSLIDKKLCHHFYAGLVADVYREFHFYIELRNSINDDKSGFEKLVKYGKKWNKLFALRKKIQSEIE